MPAKIDSNVTGGRFAEEATLGVLPGSPVWHPLEPNGYKDFGGQISTTARRPISVTRSRKKGSVTDLDSSGGFMQDLTFNNSTRLMQGFMFAAMRERKNTVPMNGAAIVVTAATAVTNKYTAAAGLNTFLVGSLVLATGFAIAANNGVKTVTTAIATELTVSEALSAEGASSGKIETVGFKFPLATLAIAMSGSLVRLTSSTTDLTTLGFIPGEWIFVGGDAVGSKFVNNQGWARISAIVATYLEFDKVDWAPVAELATGLTIQIFTGSVIRNESTEALITRRSVQLERTLGNDGNGTMSEYIVGAVANEMTLNVPTAEKVSIDFGFVAINNEQRTGTTGVKAGTRPAIVDTVAFNTASDFNRIKLSLVDATTANVLPLFGYATDMTLTVNNNVSPNKAIGVLGAFETTTGMFEVGGKVTAYFSDINAVKAVRDNADVTLDMVMVVQNRALLFDIPLLALGDGRLNVEQDKAIMVPLETMAAESKYGHTLLFQSFSYVPNAALL